MISLETLGNWGDSQALELRLEVSGVRAAMRVDGGVLCVELSGADEQVVSGSDDGGDWGGLWESFPRPGTGSPALTLWRSCSSARRMAVCEQRHQGYCYSGTLTWGKWIVSRNYDPNESILRAPASFIGCTFKSVQRLLLTSLPSRPWICIPCVNNTIIVPKRMWTNVETCLFVNGRDVVFNLTPFFVEHSFPNTVGIKVLIYFWTSLMKIEWSVSKTI